MTTLERTVRALLPRRRTGVTTVVDRAPSAASAPTLVDETPSTTSAMTPVPVRLGRPGVDLTEGRVITFTATPTRASRRAVARAARAGRHRLDQATSPVVVDIGLPTMKRRRGWGNRKAGFFGPIQVQVPKHTTSAARIGVMTPFVAPSTAAIPGPVIGVEVTSGQVFTFDPWGAGQGGARLVSSPSVVVFGLMGSGKSMCVKTCMIRLIEWGRQVIVTSDPKGEWVPIAHALGGQVIAVGPGSGTVINLLDEGTRPPGVAHAEWTRLVSARRSLALESVCAILRPDRPLDEYEQAALDKVVDLIATGHITPTVEAVVTFLEHPPASLLAHVGAEAPVSLALILGRLVTGPLGGMFHTHSTVALDPGAPMTVIDTSALLGASAQVRQIAAAATSAWVDATLRSADGRWRCVVSEEGWDELRNPAQAKAMDERLRMAGHWRCSSWLIFHELADIEQFGQAGSAHRNQVAGIITKSPIKILYQQSAASMDRITEFVRPTIAEAAILTSLRQGIGSWHVGEATPVLIHPVIGKSAYLLLNTDAGRDGGN